MSDSEQPDVRACSGRQVGKACPHCEELLAADAPVVVCPSCLAPQHAGCWQSGGGCASYFCSPETRRASAGAADITISLSEIEAADAAPLRAHATMRRRPPAPIASRVDPVATTALAMGALSLVPLVGLLACPFAVLAATVSCGRIGAVRELSGLRRALAGLLLGLIGFGGHGVWLYVRQLERDPSRGLDSPFLTARELPEPPPASELARIRPVVRHAMKANVYIRGRYGLTVWTGSGIVVATRGDRVRVLTNRHVADGPSGGDGALEIQTCFGARTRAKVLWRSDHVDAALLEADIPGAEDDLEVARAASRELPQIGGRVFAIGNPHNLTWSYSEGVVSSLRRHKVGDGEVIYIQHQTPINSGNSGGALYDERGCLVGMNSWKIDQAVGEGLSFAIAVDSLLERKGDLIAIGRPAAKAVRAKSGDGPPQLEPETTGPSKQEDRRP